ncbi:MAG: hypothetical protein QNJ94_10535 [Alphaproteobacteria bacterium]|nr:hypothetical protein [Alphaproteobacteria bacterium]
MPADHLTRHLTVGEIPIAFPLIQQLHGDASYSEWERFARAYLDQSSDRPGARRPPARGIVVAENHLGYLQGLFSYSLRRDTLNGPTLLCDQLIALGLLRLDSPLRALLEEAERIAKLNGGTRIELRVSNALLPDSPVQSELHNLLYDWGHRMQSWSYCKSLG